MALRRGGKAAEEDAAKNKIVFGRAEFFSLKDGETTTFRLMDHPDEWVYVDQHNFIQTKGAPPDADDKTKNSWPKTMGATCRYDECFTDEVEQDGETVKVKKYTDCYICDNLKNKKTNRPVRPQLRFWLRLVIREEVIGTQELVDAGKIKPEQVGMVVGFKDAMVEEDETDKDGKATGKKITHPKIVVANMSLDNFVGALQGYADVYAGEGGMLCRDITVTRKGSDTDTEYRFVPRNPTAGHDLADPATKAKYEEYAAQAHLSLEDLEKMIFDRATDEYYARFFDPSKPFPTFKKDGENGSAQGAPAAQQQKAPETPATQDALNAMRARVMQGNQPAAANGEAAPAADGAVANF
jgi:hypothetical protein